MKFIIGFILIFLLANCGSNIERNKNNNIATEIKKTEYPITLDLDKGFDSNKWIYLESFIDSISYIPLQTTNESWIRNIRKIIYYNNSFHIGQLSKLLQLSIPDCQPKIEVYNMMGDFIINYDNSTAELTLYNY